MFAANDIRCGEYDLVVAGGMESMSNAPYSLPQARSGYRMGNGKIIDVMIHDGLWDPYGDKHMGTCAEPCATKYKFTREAQDEFSRESYRRAQDAIKNGKFKKEIAVVEIEGKKGKSVVVDDEEPFAAPLDKIAHAQAGVREGRRHDHGRERVDDQRRRGGAGRHVGRVRAAERPDAARADRRAVDGRAGAGVVHDRAGEGDRHRRCKRANMTVDDIDLFEINEAFAAVAMAAMKDANIPHEKVNVHGGAVALGHPIGASGARILVTLIHALQERGEEARPRRDLHRRRRGGRDDRRDPLMRHAFRPLSSCSRPCRSSRRTGRTASPSSSPTPVSASRKGAAVSGTAAPAWRSRNASACAGRRRWRWGARSTRTPASSRHGGVRRGVVSGRPHRALSLRRCLPALAPLPRRRRPLGQRPRHAPRPARRPPLGRRHRRPRFQHHRALVPPRRRRHLVSNDASEPYDETLKVAVGAGFRF